MAINQPDKNKQDKQGSQQGDMKSPGRDQQERQRTQGNEPMRDDQKRKDQKIDTDRKDWNR